MKVDSSQVEDKVLKAAGVVAEAQLQEAPKVEEVDIIPKRNAGAMRSDQVSHCIALVNTRAANDPSVFTITEKAPTRASY